MRTFRGLLRSSSCLLEAPQWTASPPHLFKIDNWRYKQCGSILVVYNAQASGANANIPSACSGPDTVPTQSSLPCPHFRGQISHSTWKGESSPMWPMIIVSLGIVRRSHWNTSLGLEIRFCMPTPTSSAHYSCSFVIIIALITLQHWAGSKGQMWINRDIQILTLFEDERENFIVVERSSPLDDGVFGNFLEQNALGDEGFWRLILWDTLKYHMDYF